MFKLGDVIKISSIACDVFNITQPYGIICGKFLTDVYTIRILELYISSEEEDSIGTMGHYNLDISESEISHA